ncbi:trichothecene biosynthesis acetyltransferase [Aspergillus bertholletiae]|uniref:Trichothecene biosynthesis acetyltransferase n=1 Tax=Aspergillus bertholletiae TaxID=1226010 RepID=A0A5N7ARN3_9EURO|nr:trichothecene biosynthesis acetyltransferase [Aspergillus bertholletiae]
MEENNNHLDRYQDILGQLPMLQAYSHILYMFPTPKNATREEIVQSLEKAVCEVKEKVPWMGGRVVNVGRKSGNSGIYKVVPCAPPEAHIVIRDFSDTLPAYSAIKAKKAPLSMIDTRLLTPVPGFPRRFEDSDENPARVIWLQVSFVKGGLIIDFVIHHNMADAGGHFGFVKLVAMVMRGEKIPCYVIEQANRDRRSLFSLLAPNEPMLDHSHHKCRPPAGDSSFPMEPEQARYHVIRFTTTNMRRLKDLAQYHKTLDPNISFISTDDILCAFCWKHFTRVRLRRFKSDTRSRFSRAVDGRKALNIAPGYMGDVIHNVTTWLSFKELTEAPLGTVASHLRKNLIRLNTAYHIRSFASFISSEPDKATITYGGQFNPSTDVGCSSIRGMTDAFPDFGLLGQPDLIRRPPTDPFPGLLVLIPGSPGGDCDAYVCLTDTDMVALSMDPEWTEYVEYIG